MKTICIYDPRTKTVRTLPVYDDNIYWIVEGPPGKINPEYVKNEYSPIAKISERFLPPALQQ